jgi:hypothetical protein
MMPYDAHKYKGLDYYWRAALAGISCMAVTTYLTYPLDLIHTRITTDLTKKGQPRLYTTTFDCFSRTNLDEGRKGLFKGIWVTVLGSAIRGAFTLPLYDVLKQYKPQNDNSLVNNFWYKLGPSALTSLIVSTIIYPFDTVKRCM